MSSVFQRSLLTKRVVLQELESGGNVKDTSDSYILQLSVELSGSLPTKLLSCCTSQNYLKLVPFKYFLCFLILSHFLEDRLRPSTLHNIAVFLYCIFFKIHDSEKYETQYFEKSNCLHVILDSDFFLHTHTSFNTSLFSQTHLHSIIMSDHDHFPLSLQIVIIIDYLSSSFSCIVIIIISL